MIKKRLFVALFSCLLLFSLSFLMGCNSASSNEPQYSDKDFINSMSKGLENRWDISENPNHPETVSGLEECVDAELKELTQYESATFEDTKLQEKALQYINILKDSKEHAAWNYSNNYKDVEKWEDLYNQRTVLIKYFVENYNLTVDDKYQDIMKEFLSNGESVENESAVETALEKEANNIKFKLVEDDGYGWKTYRGKFKNKTGQELKDLSLAINLLDKEGTVVATEYSNLNNLENDQKAVVEFSTDKKFKNVKVVPDYYELKE